MENIKICVEDMPKQKQKIVLYGGCFNPLHAGHIKIINILTGHFDAVWVTPTYISLYGKELAPYQDRVAALRNHFSNSAEVRILESDRTLYQKVQDPDKMTTVCIIDFVWENYIVKDNSGTLNPKEIELFYCTGMDNANKVPEWLDGQKLIDNYRVVVVPRKGYKPETDWFRRAPHMYLPEADIPDISSTQIRAKLAENGENKK